MDKENLKIEELLARWAEKIYPSKEDFLAALKSKKLVIYHGVDPTSPELHLGHSTNYLLLRKFQELGHKIVLLIGDFTAQIGDPTGRLSARKSLTKKQVLENCQRYKEQAGKILDFESNKNPVQIEFNSKWLAKMNLEEVIKLSANFTVGQMLKRNMFQERIEKNQEIFLHEFLYPLLQGYDSVAMKVDAEVGGSDQTFNMLVGRDLVKNYLGKEKFVVTTLLLENPKTGKKLMSKSEGGYISLDEKPEEMYGKVMALPDEVIIPCFKLCTEVSLAEIKSFEEDLDFKTVNPRDLKARLAEEIVKIYHGQGAGRKAGEEFEKVFKKGEVPTEIPEVKIKETELPILDLLVRIKIASSKSEAKRLILQKGVRINRQIETDWQKKIGIKEGMIIQAGKRKFVKIN